MARWLTWHVGELPSFTLQATTSETVEHVTCVGASDDRWPLDHAATWPMKCRWIVSIWGYSMSCTYIYIYVCIYIYIYTHMALPRKSLRLEFLILFWGTSHFAMDSQVLDLPGSAWDDCLCGDPGAHFGTSGDRGTGSRILVNIPLCQENGTTLTSINICNIGKQLLRHFLTSSLHSLHHFPLDR